MRYRAIGAYPPSTIRHQVQYGIFFGRHWHRMQPFRLGQHRALEIQGQYADDALKFRVIRSWGGCNANNILGWSTFDIHRNEETIDWIRQEVDGYDKGLKTLFDSLMQRN